MTETKTLDELFATFAEQRSNDRKLPLDHMHRDGQFVYACNGHVGFEIPADMLEGQYGKVPAYPNVRGLMSDNDDGTRYLLENIRIALAKWQEEPVYETKDCAHCNATGQEYCACCERYSDCEVCEGDGVLQTENVVGFVMNAGPFEHVKIGRGYFDPTYVHRIGKVVEALGELGILVTAPSDGKSIMGFRIGRVRGVLMPMFLNDGPSDYHTIVEVSP